MSGRGDSGGPSGGGQLFGDGPAAVWWPGAAELERSRLAGLMRTEGVGSLEALHRRAVADPEWFWRAAVPDLGIEFSRPFEAVADYSEGPEFPRWFPGGALNLGAHCLDRWVAADGEAAAKAAVIWENEAGLCRTVSYAELHRETAALSGWLRSVGVEPGDRVGLFMPLIPATFAVFIACARIGAVAVPAFTGYGPEALATRLRAARAKVLVCADGFVRRGAEVAMVPTVEAALAEAGSVERVVVVDHAGIEHGTEPGRDIGWKEALAEGERSGLGVQPVELDPDHPFLLVYTSGTTGAPKGIVHSHGGFLAKVGLDFGYCFDVQADDVLLWNTDPGWLVGPLLAVGALMFNATAVTYEGSPDRPDLGRLWALAERHRASLVGVAPSLVRAMMTADEGGVSSHDRAGIRAFVSTGEAWHEDSWRWLFETVGERRRPILNYSGGTEIGGGILTCYPIAPIAPCGFSGPVIGCDADVFGPEGTPVEGAIGELVMRNLLPGVTHGFWEDRERYLETYWNEWPGTWRHGDLATRREDGFWFIAGRSDDTIKVSGKRIGPAEIEAVLLRHPAVAEAIAIGVPDRRSGNAIVCLAVLNPGAVADDEVAAELSALVPERLDKTLRLREVHFVGALPKTKTGKTMRRVARSHYLGEPSGDLSSIEDPAVVAGLPREPETAE